MLHKLFKSYYISRKEHYGRLIFPKNYTEFQFLLNDEKSTTVRKSISFNDINFGSTSEVVINALGKPTFFIEANSLSHRVCFYKKNILDHEIVVQYHFFDNKFVCACQTILESNPEWRTLVINTLYEKLGLSHDLNRVLKAVEGEQENVLFSDSFNNTIILIEKFTLNIFYVTGNENLKELVKNFDLAKKQQVINEKQKLKNELMEKL